MNKEKVQAVPYHPPVLEHLTARHVLQREHLSDNSNTNSHTSHPPPSNPPRSPTTYSEHGHNLTTIKPMTKHHGTSVNNFFNGLFTTIIAISTLSTSITFSFVLSNQTVPPPLTSRFSADSVQLFLAISWLCSLLCLAFAALGSTLLTFFRKHWVRDWDGENGKTSQLAVQLYAVSASSIMGSLLTASFIFMCLVVVAYQPVVGWISLGFTSIFGSVIVVSICNQVPWTWNDNTPSRTQTEAEIEKDQDRGGSMV